LDSRDRLVDERRLRASGDDWRIRDDWLRRRWCICVERIWQWRHRGERELERPHIVGRSGRRRNVDGDRAKQRNIDGHGAWRRSRVFQHRVFQHRVFQHRVFQHRVFQHRNHERGVVELDGEHEQ
jgi:hypothetical protein